MNLAENERKRFKISRPTSLKSLTKEEFNQMFKQTICSQINNFIFNNGSF